MNSYGICRTNKQFRLIRNLKRNIFILENIQKRFFIQVHKETRHEVEMKSARNCSEISNEI